VSRATNKAIARRFFEDALARQCERAADDVAAALAAGETAGPRGMTA
jgi:hypothetical protein